MHVRFIWQISFRARHVWNTMRVFCDLKNMSVTVITFKKVYSKSVVTLAIASIPAD